MKRTDTILWVAVVAGTLSTVWTRGQSADGLIDKLVQKGVLTAQEASELRQESQPNQASSAKSGMPSWVLALKFSGDFRGRYEGFYFENNDAVDRHRFRYRARLGVTATLFDNLEVGLRLGSG